METERCCWLFPLIDGAVWRRPICTKWKKSNPFWLRVADFNFMLMHALAAKAGLLRPVNKELSLQGRATVQLLLAS